MNLDAALRHVNEPAASALVLLPGLLLGLAVFGLVLPVGRLVSAGPARDGGDDGA